MGEPAIPTDAERTERLVLARAVVDSVRNDESGPLDVPEAFDVAMIAPNEWPNRLDARAELRAWVEKVDLVLFSFAQEIATLTEERDRLHNGFCCIECGFGAVDEDGCCTTCGRDCLAFLNGKLKLTPVSHFDAVEKERDALVTRRDELLALVARVTNETPYPDEIKGWQDQKAKLVAEIGTLKAQVAEAQRERDEYGADIRRMCGTMTAADVLTTETWQRKVDEADGRAERRTAEAIATWLDERRTHHCELQEACIDAMNQTSDREVAEDEQEHEVASLCANDWARAIREGKWRP
jgi:hypothetical protein